MILGSCSSDREASTQPAATTPTSSTSATTSVPSPARTARLGAAVTAKRLESDPAYAALVAERFDSVTPENAMKWSVARPTATTWDWTGADAAVDFAQRKGLQVRGHTLVWGQPSGNGIPAWLDAMTDPGEFTAAVLDGITTQVGRYRGRVQRWDVVNEPLNPLDGDVHRNVFVERMGPDYIERTLKAARAADPNAELWINENGTEYLPAKAEGLVELVRGLKAQGVPLDGVGLQTHLFVDGPLRAGGISDVVGRLRALGVEVAVTEADVPGGSPNRDAAAQEAMWRQVAQECVSSGCVELTVWGVSDADTWLDDPGLRQTVPFLAAFPVPTRPLLFDENLKPKPAFQAVEDVLAPGG